MESESLRHKTAKGVIWSSIERFATIGVQIIVNIILARILSPGDFGLIAEILIFIQLSQLLIDGGFTTALIQRKERSDQDFSTIFIFNVVISIFCYIVLFLCAPLIADFYNEILLRDITRVVGLNFVIGAFIAIPRTKLTIEVRFKEQSIISLISASFSGVIAVVLAHNGMGVWSLVYQTIINITCQTIMTWFIVKWYPSVGFSWKVLKDMIGYSSKCFSSSMIHLLYTNLYPIFIGKFYNKTELGFYNRADFFSMMPAQTIGSSISRVAFPIFSTIQDDDSRLCKAYSQYIRFSSAIVFPVMFGLLAVAHPLILLALTEKWAPAIPLLQILCFAWMFDHISQINLNVLYVKGRPDIALRLEIFKKTIALLILFTTIPFGLVAICWGRVLYSIIAVAFNTHYTNMLIGITRSSQIHDFLPYLLLSGIMGIIVWSITTLPFEQWALLIISILSGVAIYTSLIYVFQRKIFEEFLSIIWKK